MKANEFYEKMLRDVKGTLEFELEGVLLDLTEQIVQNMEREGLNRTELAKRLGVSNAYVTKLLTGQPNMTLETVVKVARALRCEAYLNLQFKHVLNVPHENGAPEYEMYNHSVQGLDYGYSSSSAA